MPPSWLVSCPTPSMSWWPSWHGLPIQCQWNYNLASFADSKLLDFVRLAVVIILRINWMLCITWIYNNIIRIINPRCVRFRHGCKNCWRWSLPPPSSLSSLASFWQRQWLLFNSNGSYACLAAMPYAFLWYPFWQESEATVRDVGTHQCCCCCEPLNLEQYCCASIIIALSPALNVVVASPLALYPFSVCNCSTETCS